MAGKVGAEGRVRRAVNLWAGGERVVDADLDNAVLGDCHQLLNCKLERERERERMNVSVKPLKCH